MVKGDLRARSTLGGRRVFHRLRPKCCAPSEMHFGCLETRGVRAGTPPVVISSSSNKPSLAKDLFTSKSVQELSSEHKGVPLNLNLC